MADTIPHRLASILEYKRTEVTELASRYSRADLEAMANEAPPPRPFEAALLERAAKDHNALICEVKRKSPSAGQISQAPEPADFAKAYETGGAACISVLTDGPSFGGSPEDLKAVHAGVNIPILRKDFMIDPLQIVESRAMGADAILVIMAAVSDTLARELSDTATTLGMAVLVESHTEAELERALKLSSPLMGVNNRDLHTFTTDLGTTERLSSLVPPERLLIAESGISTTADVTRLRQARARSFLIGEAAMRADDPAKFIESLANTR